MGVTFLPGETLKEILTRVEREVIAAAMASCNNQVPTVAEKLGVSVRTIYRYL
jgi:DNA-binding NtrC family response regulator